MTEFTLVGLDGNESDEIEIISDEKTTLDLKHEHDTLKKQKKKQNAHSGKANTISLDLAYTIDNDDEPHSHQSGKKIRTYSRNKGHSTPVVKSTRTSNASNKSPNGHAPPPTSHANGHAHSTLLTDTVFLLPAQSKQKRELPHKKRARESTDEESAPNNKKQRAEAQPFLEKLTEKFRAPQPVITMPNKVISTSEEKKRNNSKRTVQIEPRDSPTIPSKLGKESSVFRAGSNTHPLRVSDELTPVKQQPPVPRVTQKHKSRADERSRDPDPVEVVILNDLNDADDSEAESPREIEPAFLDMTGDECHHDARDSESSSCDQSFDLFDSQPLTASRDSKPGTLPRLALVCVQIGVQVVRDTDVKGEFVLRVKSDCLSVSAVDASSPPIEIEISDNLLQVQYSALHRLLVLRFKTPPVTFTGFYRNSDRPCMALILAEELTEEHKRHLQSLLQARERKLDKYDDRKLKIDLVPDVYAQYVKRQQGVDLTLSSDHVPLEIHGEIRDSDEVPGDDEYRARDASSPPRSQRILRSSRASVQSAEEIHAEMEHKRANVLCVWPKGARDSVSITELDLARLEPNEFLNDVIIDFYLLWIRDHLLGTARVYFYNSFFYNLLTRKSQGYNKVKKWTKHVDIFDYDYLVVPINQHFHWRVCIVYHPRRLLSRASAESDESESAAPYLIMLDSLQGSAGSVYRAIKEYLQKEWHDKHGTRTDVELDMTRLKTVMPKAPTQDNHYDCGIFVLQYVESFCKKPVTSPSYITPSWFSPTVIANKRREIRNIILKLAEEQGHHISNSKTAWEEDSQGDRSV